MDFNSLRYPQLSDPNLPEDIKNTFSELIRTLELRDAVPVTPSQIYGRTVEYGGPSLTGLTYIGFTNVGTPTSDNWHVYEVQVPRDVGTIVSVNPDTAPRTQLRIFLPKASLVPGRTISIVVNNTGAVNPFNTSINVISGDTFVLAPIPNPTIGGTISVPATTTASIPNTNTFFTPWGWVSSGGVFNQIYFRPGVGFIEQSAYNPATDRPMGILVSTNGISNVSTFTTNTTPSLNLSVTTNQPLAWTFRAYGDIWYQIP